MQYKRPLVMQHNRPHLYFRSFFPSVSSVRSVRLPSVRSRLEALTAGLWRRERLQEWAPLSTHSGVSASRRERREAWAPRVAFVSTVNIREISWSWQVDPKHDPCIWAVESESSWQSIHSPTLVVGVVRFLSAEGPPSFLLTSFPSSTSIEIPTSIAL